MNREEYNTCMKPYMSGSKSKEERQRDFCVGAKICSGKAKTEDEAQEICSLPKSPKEPKTRRARTECDVEQIVSCLIKNIDFESEDPMESLRKSVQLCVCKEKPKSKAQRTRELLKEIGYEEKID